MQIANTLLIRSHLIKSIRRHFQLDFSAVSLSIRVMLRTSCFTRSLICLHQNLEVCTKRESQRRWLRQSGNPTLKVNTLFTLEERIASTKLARHLTFQSGERVRADRSSKPSVWNRHVVFLETLYFIKACWYDSPKKRSFTIEITPWLHRVLSLFEYTVGQSWRDFHQMAKL